MNVFSFVKKVLVLGLTVLSGSITSALKCLSMNNQKCKVRPKIFSVSSNNPIFYPFSVKRKIGAVVIVIVLMILKQRFAFLIL